MGAEAVRIGSVFSGVEGMGLGVLAALDGRIVWHAEVDPHASAVLARHFDAPNLGDVRAVDWASVEPVDLLIGGPPCQAISQAGRRRGMADERWMWPEAFRAMGELRPRWVLWENPIGLLTGRQREDDVLGEMASLGYVGTWGCLRSSDAGAPHGRARVFIAAADADDLGRERPVAGPFSGGPPVALLPTPSAREAERWGMPSAATAAARVLHPNRSVNLEDAVALLPTPTTAPTTGNGHARNLGTETKRVDDTWLATLPDGRTIDYGPAVRRWQAVCGEPAPSPRDERGRLNPELPRWMMGYPAGWFDGLPRTAALRCAGNGCQPQTARLAAEILLPTPLAPPEAQR